MKNVLVLILALVSLNSASVFAAEAKKAEPKKTAVSAENIAGTYEGIVVSPEIPNVEQYSFKYVLKADGTLSYTEYYDKAQTVGILGDKETPACTGTYTLKASTLTLTTDCSTYTAKYTEVIDLSQASVEELSTKTGKQVKATSTLMEGAELVVALRKL